MKIRSILLSIVTLALCVGSTHAQGERDRGLSVTESQAVGAVIRHISSGPAARDAAAPTVSRRYSPDYYRVYSRRQQQAGKPQRVAVAATSTANKPAPTPAPRIVAATPPPAKPAPALPPRPAVQVKRVAVAPTPVPPAPAPKIQPRRVVMAPAPPKPAARPRAVQPLAVAKATPYPRRVAMLPLPAKPSAPAIPARRKVGAPATPEPVRVLFREPNQS